MRRVLFFISFISLCSAFSWSQAWDLTETMTAKLDSVGVLTISSSKEAGEEMPDYFYHVIFLKNDAPWGGVCSEISSVIMNENVTTIGGGAFFLCKNIVSFTIPKHIKKIGWGAFDACTGLKDVIVAWEKPLSVGVIFDAVNTSVATLHVPTGTKALYEATDVWKSFGKIVEYSPTNTAKIENPTLKAYASNGILVISGLQFNKSLSIFSINGNLVYKGVTKAETEQIPLNTQGTYIVIAENQAIKVVVR